jgi:hypothetical protein
MRLWDLLMNRDDAVGDRKRRSTMRCIWRELVTVGGLCLVMLPRPALSADDACAADKAKFCAKLDTKTLTVGKCLKEHEAQLSDACKKKVANAMAQAEARKACKADVKKFCEGVKPGEGRIAACLKQHEGKLSEGCTAARAANRHAGG